jgi:iron complex transport system ATP-binding protein
MTAPARPTPGSAGLPTASPGTPPHVPDEAPAPRLAAERLTLAYDGRPVVHEVDLEVRPGEVTIVVGANGCGKSTLLRGLGRLLRPVSGTVRLGEADIASLRPRQVAEVVGLLPQQPVAPEGITVGDLVARGRYPHQGVFARSSSGDRDVVARALAATDTHELAGRRVDELSGGQRQRVWIAMVLAQDPRIMLLDEPTTYLDIAHQVEVLDLLVDLNKNRGTTVVMVLHDLGLSARYADHLVAIRGGEVYAEGRPVDVVTEAMVSDVFGLESRVVVDPVSATPLILPIGRHHRGAPQ